MAADMVLTVLPGEINPPGLRAAGPSCKFVALQLFSSKLENPLMSCFEGGAKPAARTA